MLFAVIYNTPAVFLRDSKKDGPNSRIVVFIDDLDRCMPEKAVEVLESIKTFFDIEGMIYVIGMDSPNDVVDQWAKNIVEIFPDSKVKTGKEAY